MPARYAIVVKGPVGPLTLSALDGFRVAGSGDDEVRLEGTVVDEAALHGVLHHLQDLRLELLRLERLPDG